MKEKAKKVISCLIFFLLLFFMFIVLQRVMTPVSTDNDNIYNFKNEKNIDVVYIGGSAAYNYWQPLKAWNDFGFTSYNYSTNNIQAENIKYCIKEVLRVAKSDPKLFVIGVRSFDYWDENMNELGLRGFADYMSVFSPNRYAMIHDMLKRRTGVSQEDKLGYYIPLIKYHTRQESLHEKDSWNQVFLDTKEKFKGTSAVANHYHLNPISPNQNKTKELPTQAEQILRELLDFCQKEDLNVLFVTSPFYCDQNHFMMHNRIGEIIEEHGYRYIDANNYYKEMKIDFATDFFDMSHCNLLGAEKYTNFLGDYIVNHYDLPDHRNESSYSEWDENYQLFKQDINDGTSKLKELIKKSNQSVEVADKLSYIYDINEWNNIVRENQITVFVSKNSEIKPLKNLSHRTIFNSWGLEKNRMNVLCNGSIVQSGNQGSLEGKAGMEKYVVDYDISNKDGKTRMVIDDNVLESADKGIFVVAMENQTKGIADKFMLVNDHGHLAIVR